MSGIYFPGMEMPTSCRACHLKMNCEDCEGWECVCLPLQMKIGYWDDLLADNRREDCPLVSVPEHGRLIDADALCAKDNGDFETALSMTLSVSTKSTIMRIHEQMQAVISEAPTIIPADPADKEGAV